MSNAEEILGVVDEFAERSFGLEQVSLKVMKSFPMM